MTAVHAPVIIVLRRIDLELRLKAWDAARTVADTLSKAGRAGKLPIGAVEFVAPVQRCPGSSRETGPFTYIDNSRSDLENGNQRS